MNIEVETNSRESLEHEKYIKATSVMTSENNLRAVFLQFERSFQVQRMYTSCVELHIKFEYE